MRASRMQVETAPPLDFAPFMGQVARRLLVNPNERLSKDNALRFGTNGSMKVNTEAGWFPEPRTAAPNASRTLSPITPNLSAELRPPHTNP